MQNKHNVDVCFFPGWTRKSLTFTIDDGNLKLDRKFINIVAPAGITGTFNLMSNSINEENREAYIAQYAPYEVANHCKRHPFAIPDGDTRPISDEPYDPKTAKMEFLYKTDMDGLYHEGSPKAYRVGAVPQVYLRLAEESRAELDEIFGEGTVHAFVWPYGMQRNEEVTAGIKSMGYQYIRKTGDLLDTTDFDLPDDRLMWSYNAHNRNMLEVMEKYEAFPDDGRLKMFAFGVHSHDFENDGNWDVLEQFCDKYGNRPEDYWYATVHDILSYEDAVKAIAVTDSEVINNSDIKLYIKIDGKRVTLPSRAKILI